MTKQQIKDQLKRRIEYLKEERSKHLKDAKRYDEVGNYADADIHFFTANACLSRISECEMIIDLL